jgi:hypothetical protein
MGGADSRQWSEGRETRHGFSHSATVAVELIFLSKETRLRTFHDFPKSSELGGDLEELWPSEETGVQRGGRLVGSHGEDPQHLREERRRDKKERARFECT